MFASHAIFVKPLQSINATTTLVAVVFAAVANSLDGEVCVDADVPVSN